MQTGCARLLPSEHKRAVTVTVTVATVTETRRPTTGVLPRRFRHAAQIRDALATTHTRPLTSQPFPTKPRSRTHRHTRNPHSATQTSTPPTNTPHPTPSSCSYPAGSVLWRTYTVHQSTPEPKPKGRTRSPRRPTSSCPRTCGPNLAHAPNAPLARGSPRRPLPCCTGIVISPCWLPTPRPSSLPTEASPYTLPEASISSGAACTRPQAHTNTSTRHAHAMRTREYT